MPFQVWEPRMFSGTTVSHFMRDRVATFLPLRPVSRHPLSSGSPEISAAAIVLLAARHGTVRNSMNNTQKAVWLSTGLKQVSDSEDGKDQLNGGEKLHRTNNNIQRYFGTNSVICSKKGDRSVGTDETSKVTSESQDSEKENPKKDLLSIIKGMKVELSTVNVQTTRPPNRRPLKGLEGALGRLQRATEHPPKKRIEPLSPELVAAVSAVADSLPFDKQTTKSELLRQLQQHEEESRAQSDAERPKISFSNIISDMKVARSATARVHLRPEHQIRFDEGHDNYPEQTTADFRKRITKNLFKGKRLYIFDMTAATKEDPETDTVPSLWDVEFAKELATVNEQPLQNGFEELIQWTKEGKLWEFPINNEADIR
ncbi:28S ribosomal protein S31, mitochondrial [Saguinus oedipus]|uniref:Small ribosomal subunit protein mS31 n=1 Tax=Saguinus oedipus TaxID=9490 RepID=A0ABQ9VUC6_SAGOE|nr:28S ribosomal protein S31, mitochondrial [Saguinus oedipus]